MTSSGTSTPRATVLGVEASVSGKRWEMRCDDERHALALSQRLGLPDVVGRVLTARGVSLEGAEYFLSPSLRSYLPNPSVVADMDKAAAYLADAVRSGKNIAVFGDYDVDGATSSALLKRFLETVGGKVSVYIPDRIEEGYGPNSNALLKLKEQGADVVVTVDCGISAFEPLETAAEAGLDVLVVDHHVAEARLPEAVAVVNPNRLDDESGLGQMAAVGVSFLLCVAINRILREGQWYNEVRREPRLMDWLDLVALGTVCDVVPLTGVNRAYVHQGLKIMARRSNIGLAALADVSRMDEKPGTYHAGFLLGPRVNAGGRVGQADLGVRLLSTRNPEEAARISEQLDGYNSERREIEAQVLQQALEQVEEGPEPQGFVFAAAEGWHPGVIGIVASRLKDRWNLPSLVISLDDKGIGKGSGRSVPGVDLGAAVTAARQNGLLINGGGHVMAAGVTVSKDRLGDLRAFLKERLQKAIETSGYKPSLGFDGVLTASGANFDLFSDLERIAPFGTGNPEPRFVLNHTQIMRADPVGQNHVRLSLSSEGGRRLKGIAFRCLEEPLGQLLLASKGRALHLAGKLRQDSWSGPQAVQFIVEDAAVPQN